MCFALCLAHGAKLIKFNVYILADNSPSYILKTFHSLCLHVSIKPGQVPYFRGD